MFSAVQSVLTVFLSFYGLKTVYCEKSLSTDKQCLNATYYVQQLYQACPAKGQVITPDGNKGVNSDRIIALEEDHATLKATLSSLQSQMAALMSRPCRRPDRGNQAVKDVVHKVLRPDGSLPADCTEIFNMGYRCTGVYWIEPKLSPNPIKALCELSYDGWTVLMRRYDGRVDFFRKWSDYKHGFGSPLAEHWIGNDNMHYLTNQKNYQLRVDVTVWSTGYTYYADYQRFKIESEDNKYKLHVTGYSGTSGYDGLSYHNNRPFSTWDRENDSWSKHCAQEYKGAWWYGACSHGHLTGIRESPCKTFPCIYWNNYLGAAVMKVKPI